MPRERRVPQADVLLSSVRGRGGRWAGRLSAPPAFPRPGHSPCSREGDRQPVLGQVQVELEIMKMCPFLHV